MCLLNVFSNMWNKGQRKKACVIRVASVELVRMESNAYKVKG